VGLPNPFVPVQSEPPLKTSEDEPRGPVNSSGILDVGMAGSSAAIRRCREFAPFVRWWLEI
jgi:hypothetical protein